MNWRLANTTIFMFCLAATAPAASFADELTKIVDDFILYDTGRLSGQPGREAYQKFQGLQGDRAIDAVVGGVNRAAKINASCPIIVVAGKLQTLLVQTMDPAVLRRAHDNMVAEGPYASYVQNLRRFAAQRLEELNGEKLEALSLRGGGTPGRLRRMQKGDVSKWSEIDLRDSIKDDKGAELASTLGEMSRRPESKYDDALASAIGVVDDDVRQVARGLLSQRFTRLDDERLKDKLSHHNPEVRAAAVRAIGYKGSKLYSELADTMRDPNTMVASDAKVVLQKLLAQDFGPARDDAPSVQWFEASGRWKKWLRENGLAQ